MEVTKSIVETCQWRGWTICDRLGLEDAEFEIRCRSLTGVVTEGGARMGSDAATRRGKPVAEGDQKLRGYHSFYYNIHIN
jgi:hypothetical protein